MKIRGRFSATGFGPAVAANGDAVHVVWIEDAKTMYRRSDGAGVTWSSPMRLSSTLLGHRDRADIAVRGDTVHVVWGDTGVGNWEVFYRRSRDGGVTWLKRTRLTRNDDLSQFPSVAVRESTVHVVWWQGPGGIDYRRSDDAGATWSKATSLGGTPVVGSPPDIVAAKSAVLVAWQSNSGGGSQIVYRRSVNGGQTWAPERPLTKKLDARSSPSLTAGGNRIHVVWTEQPGSSMEVFYRRSLDGAATWNTVKRITRNSGDSVATGVADDAKTVHLLWRDDTRGGPGTSSTSAGRSRHRRKVRQPRSRHPGPSPGAAASLWYS